MKGLSIAAMALWALTNGSLAVATEPPETAPTADASACVVVLEDGTRLSLAEVLTIELQEGVTVKLSFDERDGRHVLTSIESAE